jgi:hypothetical protein
VSILVRPLLRYVAWNENNERSPAHRWWGGGAAAGKLVFQLLLLHASQYNYMHNERCQRVAAALSHIYPGWHSRDVTELRGSGCLNCILLYWIATHWMTPQAGVKLHFEMRTRIFIFLFAYTLLFHPLAPRCGRELYNM